MDEYRTHLVLCGPASTKQVPLGLVQVEMPKPSGSELDQARHVATAPESIDAAAAEAGGPLCVCLCVYGAIRDQRQKETHLSPIRCVSLWCSIMRSSIVGRGPARGSTRPSTSARQESRNPRRIAPSVSLFSFFCFFKYFSSLKTHTHTHTQKPAAWVGLSFRDD